MLAPIGLFLNFVGSFILLGSDVERIEQAVKRVDPVYLACMKGLNMIIDESKNQELVKEGRAHPYDQSVMAKGLTWWPISWFLDRHVEQNVPREAEVDIQGGWFKINGEQLTLPEDRRITLNDGGHLRPTSTVTLTATFGLIYEAFMRRIYIYGVSLLALGFLFQLINSLY
jgi:hypothetical protein